MNIENAYRDIQDRVNIYGQITVPDWLDTNPSRDEMEKMIAYHLWIVTAAKEAVRAIERKMKSGHHG